MNRIFPWIPCLAVALGSCAKLPKVVQEPQINPTGLSGAPLIRSKASDSGTPIIAGGNVPGKGPPGLTAEKDIVYTDPDNPEAGIPELSTSLAAPRRGPWEESETIARQRSVREGKPLLIWFTDSQTSPMCRALSEELFATTEFGGWATENLVRLKIDANVVVADPDLDLIARDNRAFDISHYVKAITKRYKVMGYPALIMLSPNGEVVGSYRGYKRGEAELLWGKLKHAQAVSIEADKGWRAGLEKKGYREWQDRRERKIFARLISYSDGTLTFIEPDGGRSRTQETNLSDKDRQWIADQKKLRKLQ